MTDNYKIGNRIALLRREKGLTGEKFAEILGISPQAVSKWENGKCLPETSLLPSIASLLGTSIDSILIPQELVILDAKYTNGDNCITVTDVLNRAVDCNKLRIKAEWTTDSNSVFVLTVKYQTLGGTFYTFVPQGEILELDLTSKGFDVKSNFEIAGAYYGIGNEYKSVMQKMEHYEYFNWDEIHVNHETFPSSPGVDESEYLTLVYMNQSGIHVISCEENGILRYNDDRTALYLKDTTTCMLPDVMVLEWGSSMPCTWGGALYAALKSMGENYTYEQIMGMSGACYRITFCEVWDWSALDALVAYSYDIPLYNAIGYESVWACRLEKDERVTERRRIVSDILNGKPIVAINLRVAPEWGVITGYSDNGKTLYCRTYFDSERLNENKDYLETENWPFIITHFGGKREKPSSVEILKNSLRALINSFDAPPRDGYFQGRQGYEKWIEGLRNDNIWNADCPEHDLNRRFDVHLSTVYQLADARKCACVYLLEYCGIVDGDIREMLEEMAETYKIFTERLNTFKDGLLQKGVSSFTEPGSGKIMREEQALLLESALQEELKNIEIAKEIIKLLESKENPKKDIIFSDDEIIKAVFKDINCIYEYTLTRSKPEKADGNKVTHIKITSPQDETNLIEKTYGQNDAELHQYKFASSYIKSIPHIYMIDAESRTVIKEDLNKGYVRGCYFDEDNEEGLFIRKNYKMILKTAANWHGAFWENHDAFSQIGLDWRFETKENLLSHISMMEKDFIKYRKNEESGKIPKVWEDEYEGTKLRFENNITGQQLDYFTNVIQRLKNEYLDLVESRFHKGKNITVIHGDMHPGTAYISESADKIVKFDGLQAVRMGLPTEDLAMLIALHIEPEKEKAKPLLDDYYRFLTESIDDYPYETFINDYKISVMENMFFTIRLINRGIYDFTMRDRAIRAFETFVPEK